MIDPCFDTFLSLYNHDYDYERRSFERLLKVLCEEKKIAWDFSFIYCYEAGKFIPFSRIPTIPTSFFEGVLNTIFVMKSLIETIQKVINGEPLSKEKVIYPFNNITIPDHAFREPGIIIEKNYYKLSPDTKGQIMLNGPYKLSEKISSMDRLIEDYKKHAEIYNESIKKQCEEYIKSLSPDLKNDFMKLNKNKSSLSSRFMFYKNQHWSVLYSRSFENCYINLECPPYILEETNHKFYVIERSVIEHDIPTCSTKRLIASLECGFTGMIPYILEPHDFVHPFCSEGRVCTAGYADLEANNPNFFSGIVEALLGTRQILRNGYSDFRFSMEQRFKPFKCLSALSGLKRFDSIEEAKKTGLPIYRYYIEDRE